MQRQHYLSQLRDLVDRNPVVALVGPRQCGKTTLAKAHARTASRAGRSVEYFDLEDPIDLARLDNPRLALEPTRDLVVIDEVQRSPELFPLLRVIVDREPRRRRFLVLGSASGELQRQTSESLAGRLAFMELTPFAHFEAPDLGRLWLRGGFPRAYLSSSDARAFAWLDTFVTTFLERDIPSFGVRIPAPAMRRFWMMLAHYHGQVLNASELGRSLQTSDKTVRHYLDVLCAAFMVRTLQPWFENIGKRQVRSPKLYLRDSGLLHALLGLRGWSALDRSPKIGASWEAFALECVLRDLGTREGDCFFWATHADAELDLLVFHEGKRIGFEVKRADAPRVTRSMRIALEDLRLDALLVVFPGDGSFALDDRITAVGLNRIASSRGVLRRMLRDRREGPSGRPARARS
jgi:predicted AAA+ superfamily ATPase